jgi:hypothetical protein
MATGHESDDLRRALVGRWVKATRTPQTERYPDRLEFTERGTFAGSNDPASRWHPLWDAGRFQFVPGGTIRMPTANDAEIEYPVKLVGEELIFAIPEHAELRYRREQ